MIYITGDTHRKFKRIKEFPFEKGDMLIILGDAGINFTLDMHDVILKEKLKKLNVTLFCIRGNHEERPENIDTYQEIELFGGKVFIEPNYPNLIFAKDGEIYNIGDYKVLVIGGAYSVDKYYRELYGFRWFKDEQLSQEEMINIYNKIKSNNFDIVLTHTCPFKYIPTEEFIPDLDQSTVDNTMEYFFDQVEESITYDKWYCGHFHTDKRKEKIRFMFHDIEEFNKELTKEDTKTLIK